MSHMSTYQWALCWIVKAFLFAVFQCAEFFALKSPRVSACQICAILLPWNAAIGRGPRLRSGVFTVARPQIAPRRLFPVIYAGAYWIVEAFPFADFEGVGSFTFKSVRIWACQICAILLPRLGGCESGDWNGVEEWLIHIYIHRYILHYMKT